MCYYYVFYLLTCLALCILCKFSQNKCRYSLWLEFITIIIKGEPISFSYMSFYKCNCFFWFHFHRILCNLTYHNVTIGLKIYDRRSCKLTLMIHKYCRLSVSTFFNLRNTRIRCTEINSIYIFHLFYPPLVFICITFGDYLLFYNQQQI